MPRTPAPLTVEKCDGHWNIIDPADGLPMAVVFREADARAFVALPQVLDCAADAIACLRQQDTDDCDAVADSLQIALAQADGPSPKE